MRGKRNKRDVQEFSINLFDNILSLHQALSDGSYRHGGYKSFHIHDPKPRDIHKASVRDRLVHHALYRILYPFFDRIFIPDSFSCRLGKGTHRALNRFRAFAYEVSKNHTKTAWVLKCDIKKFFASIDQELLIALLKNRIADTRIMHLCEEVTRSFSSNSNHPDPPAGGEGSHEILPAPTAVGADQNDHAPHKGVGLPLGNLTSQLFCNIYMNKLDQFMKHELKAKYYIRYADDFVFLSEDRNLLLKTLPQVSHFLSAQLHLALHPKKILLKTFASGVDFLGWVHFPNHRVLRTATKRRMVQRVRENLSTAAKQSYAGLLSHGNTYCIRQEIL